MSYICLGIPEATHSFIYLFIHSFIIHIFNKHFLSASYVPGSVLGSWDTGVNKKAESPAVLATAQVQLQRQKLNMNIYLYMCWVPGIKVQSAIEYTKEAPSFVCCLKQCFSEEVVLVGVTRKGGGGGRRVQAAEMVLQSKESTVVLLV